MPDEYYLGRYLGWQRETYHNVPSTSNMIPFSFGRSLSCCSVGSSGAKRLGGRFAFGPSGAVDMALNVQNVFAGRRRRRLGYNCIKGEADIGR